jgi:hypothetical protein
MLTILKWCFSQLGAVVTFLSKITTLGDFTIEYISNVKYRQNYSQKELDKLTGRTPDVLMMMLYSPKPLEWKALKELNDMLGKELLGRKLRYLISRQRKG